MYNQRDKETRGSYLGKASLDGSWTSCNQLAAMSTLAFLPSRLQFQSILSLRHQACTLVVILGSAPTFSSSMLARHIKCFEQSTTLSQLSQFCEITLLSPTAVLSLLFCCCCKEKIRGNDGIYTNPTWQMSDMFVSWRGELGWPVNVEQPARSHGDIVFKSILSLHDQQCNLLLLLLQFMAFPGMFLLVQIM